MSTLAVGTIKSISSAAPVFQNTSGTEKGQLAKAWVNFNGTGTVAIRDSFNVGSITDNGTGDYDVNFSNSFSDSNYALGQGFPPINTSSFSGRAWAVPRSRDASKVNIEIIGDGGGAFDSNYVELAAFGAN